MTTTFETAKIGEKAWDVHVGWGEVFSVGSSVAYPIAVRFKNYGTKSYTVKGLAYEEDTYQTLFWDEVKIEAPSKPLPELEVDTKVIVWNRTKSKARRHFSHFSPSGRIACFADGNTSWSAAQTSEWDNWELAE